MEYIPMHGIGNAYVMIGEDIPSPNEQSIALAKKYGTDGIILVLTSEIADARMRIFNADGSEAEMCGNGARCVGRYLVDKKGFTKSSITLETGAGIKKLYPVYKDGTAEYIKVDMGIAEVSEDLKVSDGEAVWSGTAASMGNPHYVIFCEDPGVLDLEKIGPVIEHSKCFPNRVNTEFASVLSPTHLLMRVWERGSGETAACGTGACALTAVAVEKGYCPPDTDITVTLKKGDLTIRVCSDKRVYMTGKAEYVV